MNQQEDESLPFWKMRPEIMPYDSQWAASFALEKELLCKIFGDHVLDVLHFGSTSVPGMRAKPIVDISVALKQMPPSDEVPHCWQEI
jgi:GrpB-like predicted nucleotidyltransferase (UPF0157 family)